MQAVVEINGHQYMVQEGDKVVVDRVESGAGDEMTIENVYLIFDEEKDVFQLGTPRVAGVSVQMKVVEHMQGEKIHVLKFQNKKRHRKKIGFRPQQSLLLVEKITA